MRGDQGLAAGRRAAVLVAGLQCDIGSCPLGTLSYISLRMTHQSSKLRLGQHFCASFHLHLSVQTPLHAAPQPLGGSLLPPPATVAGFTDVLSGMYVPLEAPPRHRAL